MGAGAVLVVSVDNASCCTPCNNSTDDCVAGASANAHLLPATYDVCAERRLWQMRAGRLPLISPSRFLWVWLSFSLLAGLLFATWCQAEQVARVIDGDTVVLNDVNHTVVRLAGIDAPELKQPHGQRSKASLARLVMGHEVTLRVIGSDRYQRTIADVVIDDGARNISAAATQVARGHAWFYRAYPGNDKRLPELEATAKRQMHGLWRDAFAIAPWEWRKGARPLSGFRHYSPNGQPAIGGCPNGLCPLNR